MTILLSTNNTTFCLAFLLALLAVVSTRTTISAFQPLSATTTVTLTPASTSRLFSTATPPKQEEQEATTLSEKAKEQRKPRYEPKWVKKATLAEELGDAGAVNFDKKGIKGTIPVLFATQNSNVTKTTMALPGQPLRDVATQAGQFIKYGCGKGECGTCECLVNGQWIRPCVATVPTDFTPTPTGTGSGEYYTVTCKSVKNKGISSGKFYSVRSIVIGFWNNLLGMWGIVKYRQNAKKNWQERQEYENLIRQRTKEIKAARLAKHAASTLNKNPIM